MNKSCYAFILLYVLCVDIAQAEIYKSVDAEGHATYSSMPSKGAKKLGLAPLSHSSQPSREHASHTDRTPIRSSPSDFPKVDSNTQKIRDNTRRQILLDELATEENLLSEARMNLLSPQSDNRMQALKEDVSLHNKNVSALKTELSKIK